MEIGLIGFVALAAIVTAAACIVVAILLRRVVAPNEVHIVQSSKATTSYGKDTQNGNTYYEWPHGFQLSASPKQYSL
jgi:flotillin